MSLDIFCCKKCRDASACFQNGAGNKKAAGKVSFHREQKCSPEEIIYINNNRGMFNYKTYPVHICQPSIYISNPLVPVREQKHSLFLMFQDACFQNRSQH